MTCTACALVLLTAGVVLFAVSRAGEGSDEEAVARLVAAHVQRYPRMEVQDLYKLLHQAALGSGHAVRDEAAARERLAHEIAALGPGPADPLLDPLSTDGRLARVHLRPYLEAGRDPARLLEAFVRTANSYRGTVDALEHHWQVATRMAAAGLLPFPAEELAAFFEAQAARSHPAVHHSASYREAHAPAYRVVAIEYLDREG
jgi:hypothetical protein